jgi:hypothetical protein
MQVHWVKSTKDEWLRFPEVNLSEVDTLGVYVVWRKKIGYAPRVVRVGQGDVATRVGRHKLDNDIMAECRLGAGAWVTWAAVPANYLDGVEKYLADRYEPLVGECFPDVQPIAVNLPF